MMFIKNVAFLAFLAHQSHYVRGDDIKDIISRLESIKQDASEAKEYYQDRLDYMTNESYFEELQLGRKKALGLIDAIPDEKVSEKVHGLLKKGDVKEAEKLIHSFYDKYVEDDKDEKEKKVMTENRDKILAALNDAAEHYNDEDKSFEDEFNYSESSVDLNIDRTEAINLIDTIPDKEINKKVHDLLKKGDVKAAEKLIHDHYDELVAMDEDKEEAKAFMANKDKILAALDDAAEHYKDQDKSFEDEFNYSESSVSLDYTRKEAIEMIDTIPDKEVNEKVHDLLKKGDVKAAESTIHDYFDGYVAKDLGKEDAKAFIANKDKIIAALDDAAEHYKDQDESFDYYEDNTEEQIQQALDDIVKNQKIVKASLGKLRGSN